MLERSIPDGFFNPPCQVVVERFVRRPGHGEDASTRAAYGWQSKQNWQ